MIPRILIVWGLCLSSIAAQAASIPGVKNGDFAQRQADGAPVDFQLAGAVSSVSLLKSRVDRAGWGVMFDSRRDSGSIAQMISGIDPAAGRYLRFSFRGLPQAHFSAATLYMAVEFFGQNGRISYDGKRKELYPLIQRTRANLTVNGDNHVNGAASWQTYQLDFWVPFPQVDQVRLAVGFEKGAGGKEDFTRFFVTDFTLTRLPDPVAADLPATRPSSVRPSGNLLPLGGRWYFDAQPGEAAPKTFDYTNADRLLYHDDRWSAPFAGNTTAYLRAGDKDLQGNIVARDRLVQDNVTIQFDATSMVIQTHGLPNHPTGLFPSFDFADGGNPNYIQEQINTYHIPLDPKVSPRHVVTTKDNSNHALPMGPIGIAANGVVFYNPFDADSQDASNIMDLCCGHPNPFGQYHYHKYPICLNSPWADEGTGHSPLLGWAFDGFPIYGPYESAGVMAKDVQGAQALNDFNIHWDAQRGWHYHVTPGKFPYLIGGFWGTEEARDAQGGGRGMGR
jgi:hypothetical protein